MKRLKFELSVYSLKFFIMEENGIAKIVVDTAFRIHKELGPGLFESVYESVLDYELTNEYGLLVLRQPTLPVIWKDIKLDLGFKPDIIVENKVIIELKSVEIIAPVQYKQLLTYIKLTNLKLGLLINFNEALIKNGIKRVVNGL
jgi:GxxExxY protein